jgi:hypothetical protein
MGCGVCGKGAFGQRRANDIRLATPSSSVTPFGRELVALLLGLLLGCRYQISDLKNGQLSKR